jgi:glycosyltransferase involved in cell wall biosynthesis
MSVPPTAFFVSYAFPPNGGSGVQRVFKFVKYLPGYGVPASVLTAKAVFKTTSDSTLLGDLDPATTIVRATSLDPMFVADLVSKGMSGKAKAKRPDAPATDGFKPSLMQSVTQFAFPILLKIRNLVRLPDQYIGWFPFAFLAGRKHLKTLQNPVIIASLPVYTPALVAYALSRLTGAPMMLDFRDGWADDPYLELPTRFHRWFHASLERRIVRHAKHLIVYGEWLENVYREKYPDTPCTVILNGYDVDDFSVGALPERDVTKIKLAYSGTVFQYHREFIEMVFQGVAGLPDSVRERVEVSFAGDIQLTTFDQLVDQYGLNQQVKRLGYIAHKEAIKLLLTADALLFTIPRGDVSSYTSKVFEYLAAGRPIISFVCEEGSGARLLKDFGHGPWLIDYDVARTREVFDSLPSMGEIALDYKPETLARIDRKKQALALSMIIKDVAVQGHVAA